MRIFLVTWSERNQGPTLNEMEVENRLISFHFLRECDDNWIDSYLEKGIGTGKITKIKSEKLREQHANKQK